MIDKIIKTSQSELVLIYTDRKPFTITESQGNVVKLWVYMNSQTTLTPTEAFRAQETQSEDTCPGFKITA